MSLPLNGLDCSQVAKPMSGCWSLVLFDPQAVVTEPPTSGQASVWAEESEAPGELREKGKKESQVSRPSRTTRRRLFGQGASSDEGVASGSATPAIPFARSNRAPCLDGVKARPCWFSASSSPAPEVNASMCASAVKQPTFAIVTEAGLDDLGGPGEVGHLQPVTRGHWRSCLQVRAGRLGVCRASISPTQLSVPLAFDDLSPLVANAILHLFAEALSERLLRLSLR